MKKLITYDNVNTLIEYGEILLDTKLHDGIIKDIPILGSILNIIKIGDSISDIYFIKKLQKFIIPISELTSLEYNEYNEYYNELNNDECLQEKINDNLILLINSSNDIDKPEILGIIFKAYIKQSISYDSFMQYSSFINMTNSVQIKLLKEQTKKELPLEIGQLMSSSGLAIPYIETQFGSSPLEYIFNDKGIEMIHIIFDIKII